MQNKQPPFEINEQIMAEVIEIAELIGKLVSGVKYLLSEPSPYKFG